MKVLVLSDLHLEFGNVYEVLGQLGEAAYDVVVLRKEGEGPVTAGDIQTPGVAAVDWAKRESTFSRTTPSMRHWLSTSQATTKPVQRTNQPERNRWL